MLASPPTACHPLFLRFRKGQQRTGWACPPHLFRSLFCPSVTADNRCHPEWAPSTPPAAPDLPLAALLTRLSAARGRLGCRVRQLNCNISRQAHTRRGLAGPLLADPRPSSACCDIQRMCCLAAKPPHAREASSLPPMWTRISTCAPGEAYAAASACNLPSRHGAAKQSVATYGNADRYASGRTRGAWRSPAPERACGIQSEVLDVVKGRRSCFLVPLRIGTSGSGGA